jgi:hypothetical protein
MSRYLSDEPFTYKVGRVVPFSGGMTDIDRCRHTSAFWTSRGCFRGFTNNHWSVAETDCTGGPVTIKSWLRADLVRLTWFLPRYCRLNGSKIGLLLIRLSLNIWPDFEGLISYLCLRLRRKGSKWLRGGARRGDA